MTEGQIDTTSIPIERIDTNTHTNSLDDEKLETPLKIPFQLDTFQQKSIDKISLGENILVTAPTGSGKTYCALNGIIQNLTVSPNQKIIYTSPIKALSNQKYNEFCKVFKNICKIGLITGDIKCNLDAQVLLMTAEILRNLLYKTIKTKTSLNLNIDIYNDVSCIIMDEIHYFNDPERGNVWEESLMLISPKIQLILLSATIDNAYYLSKWLTKIKQKKCNLITKNIRNVPLRTYLWYSFNNFHRINNENEKLYLKTLCNKLISFSSESYNRMRKITRKYNYLERNKMKLGQIKNLCTTLHSKQYLPCIFFLFSKKRTEYFAYRMNYIYTTNEEQVSIDVIIQEHIRKLKRTTNDSKDTILYLNNDNNYLKLLDLWKTGVAFHHSGLPTIWREMVEILCNRGYIKILFATETFAVGINAPIKTVVFSTLQKYTNDKYRFLTTHEYNQMSGRAGRRGIDQFGNVIILTNNQYLPNELFFKTITNQTQNSNLLQSQFKFTYQLICKIISDPTLTFQKFIQKTFKRMQLDDQETIINNLRSTTIDTNLLQRYVKILTKPTLYPNDFTYLHYVERMETFDTDICTYQYNQKELTKLKKLQNKFNEEFKENLTLMKTFLLQNKYIILGHSTSFNKNYQVTLKGIIASHINEINEILLTEIIYAKILDKLNGCEIAAILSIFLTTKCNLDYMSVNESNLYTLNISNNLYDAIKKIIELNQYFSDLEYAKELNGTNTNWLINFDLIEYVWLWVNGKNFNELGIKEDNICIGNFIKDILRLDNILETLEIILKIINKNNIVSRIQPMHSKLIRGFVSNQSLYLL